MTAGILQGCPLSPLRYVVVADTLLRTLAQQGPTGTNKAFADDMAPIIQDLITD